MKIGLIFFRLLLFFLPFSISFVFVNFVGFVFISLISFRFVFVDFVSFSFRFVFVDFVSFRFYFASHFTGARE